jgi:hypothetical protein
MDEPDGISIQAAVVALNDARPPQLVAASESTALRLRRQVEEYAAKLAVERLRAESAESRVLEWLNAALRNGERSRQLEAQLGQLQRERDALEALLDGLLAPGCAAGRDRNDCRAVSRLYGRCILYVGARERQRSCLRALLERQNGRLLDLDGTLTAGRSGLDSVLPCADAVFCQRDCVAHETTRQIQQLCAGRGKQFILLQGSGLEALSRGLAELAA